MLQRGTLPHACPTRLPFERTRPGDAVIVALCGDDGGGLANHVVLFTQFARLDGEACSAEPDLDGWAEAGTDRGCERAGSERRACRAAALDLYAAYVSPAAGATARWDCGGSPVVRTAFVPFELASVPIPAKPEPLEPSVIEVVSSGGQGIRPAPPIDGRVLKAVLAGFG